MQRQVLPTLHATVYVLGFLPLGILVAVGLPLGLGLGLGLVPVLVGFPILGLTLLGWRRLAGLERRRAVLVLGAPIPAPPAPAPKHPGLGARWGARLRDAATWRELGWVLLIPTVGIAAATLLVFLVSVAFAALAWPAAALLTPFDQGSGFGTWPAPALGPPAGVLVLLAAAVAARGLGAGLGRVAAFVLAPGQREVLEARVATLEDTRAGAVESADATLRRIERDLHDGAQHRLSYVAMELSRARQKLDDDPEGARALVERAHEESKRAMTELRDLVRGVHPSVLSDRGLAAALPGLAARSALPVTTRVDADPRPGRAVETAAYFVVAESLANAAKHAGAAQASVDVARTGDRLVVEVADDGRGGAALEPGGGLAGLAQRVEALDGTLTVSSPPAGGTVVRAELPCGS